MPTDRQAAQSLAVRMIAFRETLPESEQEALDSLLRSFAEQVADSVDVRRYPPSGEGLIARSGVQSVEDIRQLVRDVRAAQPQDVVAIGPTITITTVTTTIASHPIITCGPPEPEGPILETLTVKVGCEATRE